MDRLTVQKTGEQGFHKCIECNCCKSFKIDGNFVKICSKSKEEIKYPFKLFLCSHGFEPIKRRKNLWHIE